MKKTAGGFVGEAKKLSNDMGLFPKADKLSKAIHWPIGQVRQPVKWFPARQRLIGLIRSHADSFVLPPAVVRKACWRD